VSALDDYWRATADELGARFQKMRTAHNDSDVKGAANEQIVADFLRENIGRQRVATNSTIIDADGQRSDEVDIAVLNDNQPLWTGPNAQLLIAEGVDAVYQVKARLSTTEIGRIVTNARSVKRLLRPLGLNNIARASESDGPRFIDRVPYFAFAFESEITLETARATLTESLANDPYEMQPDAVFVLDRGVLINVGDNKGMIKIGPVDTARGFQLVESESDPLAFMLWCHFLMVPHILQLTHPIIRYSPFRRL
jgi:hypothetical protein